jgi:hypothetical protein
MKFVKDDRLDNFYQMTEMSDWNDAPEQEFIKWLLSYPQETWSIEACQSGLVDFLRFDSDAQPVKCGVTTVWPKGTIWFRDEQIVKAFEAKYQ